MVKAASSSLSVPEPFLVGMMMEMLIDVVDCSKGSLYLVIQTV